MRRRVLPAVAVLAVAILGCSNEAAQVPSVTATVSEPPDMATGTATVAPSTTSTPTEAAGLPPRSIEGLFLAPREVPPADAQATVGERPASPFEAWDTFDVVLYDRASMTETNLGPGSHAIFNPGVTRLAWAAGNADLARDLRVIELASGEQRDLGREQPRRWVDDETLVAVHRGTGAAEFVDIGTAERRPAQDSDFQVGFPRDERAGRWLLRGEPVEERQDEYPYWAQHFELIDTTGELGPLAFEAYAATLSPDGTLWLATPPADASVPPPQGPHIETGLVNVFEVDPVSGEARFIASAVASAPNWPFAVSATHLAWTEDYCRLDPGGGLGGRTRLYDRADGSLTELDRGFWLEFTADGLLGVGEFGPRALIDVTTLEYAFVLPDRAIDVQWSDDDRYAVLAFSGGHGGLCG